MEVILVTERCYLREMTLSDRPALERMLKDRTVMAAYEHAFADREVDEWLERQMDRYQRDGFGLWAVVNAKTGDMIGQCGITLQKIPRHCGISIQQQERADRFCRRRGIGNFNSDDSSNEVSVPEIGYLFRQDAWHLGYATESAAACKQFAFQTLLAEEVYSIIRDTNLASQRVAERNGMSVCGRFVKHYYRVAMPHLVYAAAVPECRPFAGAGDEC